MKMRAKFRVTEVVPVPDGGNTETLKMSAVCGDGGFDKDGSNEDNSFAKWTPSATLEMQITNPALHGKFKREQKFYVDFTPAE